jgi:hypothetical protein
VLSRPVDHRPSALMTITYLLGFLQSGGVTNEFESFERVNRNVDKKKGEKPPPLLAIAP